MSKATSSSAGKPYGLSRVCRVWEVARSTVYAVRARSLGPPKPPERRGPKTSLSDEVLTERIREVLAASPFHGEGYRKVWARLRFAGTRTSKARTLRLMRQAGLLAPVRVGRPHGPRAHDRTIVTAKPNEMWGTDGTSTVTTREGTATIFFAVDHCTAECVGIHAARRGTRFEAMEPLRQAVREQMGGYSQGAAAGLKLRHDHGSQFVSDHYQGELRFLGIESSPAFVREPEGNGCAERFVRTLKEQLLWLRTFETVEELRLALHEFKDRYNREWLIGRNGYLTPQQTRARLLAQAGEAA
jgi:putative transposase